MVRVLLHRMHLPERPPVFKLSSGKMVLVTETPESSQIVSLLVNHPQYALLQQCLAKSLSERPTASEVQKNLQIEQVSELVCTCMYSV